jgi:transcriptional regulator GlxA family with amidase domain
MLPDIVDTFPMCSTFFPIKDAPNTRFVDNGNIINTAGVSAGIDGALYLVSRLNGMEAAKRTAYYMEYEKWDPKAGRVEIKAEKSKSGY